MASADDHTADALLADRGYDSQPHRQTLRARGIRRLIGKRNTKHGSHLGSERWVVERTLSWLRQYRRLRLRYERRADIHEAFLALVCSLICLRALRGHLLETLRRSCGLAGATV